MAEGSRERRGQTKALKPFFSLGLSSLMILLTAMTCSPEADLILGFGAEPVEGPAPLTVEFSYETVVVDTCEITFGDGGSEDCMGTTFGGNQGVIQHTYANPGEYTAQLSVAATPGADVETESEERTITVTGAGSGEEQVLSSQGTIATGRIEALTGVRPQEDGFLPELIAIEFDSGDAHHVDFENPAAPEIGGTYSGLCPEARSAAFYQNDFAGDEIEATFIATSTNNRYLCSSGIPFGVSGQMPLGSAPGGVDGVPDTYKYAWADFEGTYFKENALVIDEVAATDDDAHVPLSPGERSCPFSVAVPDSTTAYVVGREGLAGTSTESCNDWRVLWIVDLETEQVVDTVELGSKPRNLAVSPDGAFVYVADFEEDAVYVVETDAGEVNRIIDVGDGPTDVAVTPDGNRLLVTNWNSDRIQLYDLVDDSLVHELSSSGQNPATVEVTPDGATVIVANFGTAEEGGSLAFFGLDAP